MDEDHYRSAYKEVNPNRCIFEKAITNQRCNCELKRRFIIASREGIACTSKDAVQRCTRVLEAIDNNARFSLKVVTINGPMPHNKELQVQAGGMLALQALTQTQVQDKQSKQNIVDNIHKTMEQALIQFGSTKNLPYGEIVKSVVTYQSRPKRRKK